MIFSAPCQKPVIERFERNILPTGADSAITPRNKPAKFKTERREARALEFEGQPALASVRLLPWRYSIRGVVAESPPVGKTLLSECAMTGFCHGAEKLRSHFTEGPIYSIISKKFFEKIDL